MKTLTFSRHDRMPVIGLGTWKSKPGEVYDAVISALELGYRHIDCAAVYGNEAEIGQALRQCMNTGIVKREELWITSKLWCDSFAPEDVTPAFEKTLLDLQLDYLDLYLLHWPIPLKRGQGMRTAADFVDPKKQPIIETWRALEALVGQGQVRHIGVSNFTVKKLGALMAQADIGPELNQVELHPYLQQPTLRAFCRENDIHLTAYSPLGSGDRPRALKMEGEPQLLQDPVVLELAKQLNATPAQVLLSWAIHLGISCIPKSVTEARLKENLAAESVVLSAEMLQKLEQLDLARRYISGEFWLVEDGYYTLADIWDD
ncbi:aldo/keto reductase [uncultured Neptuniibacter sp.]|uniref:aldo/keto reductase n=1 Tax=uncultured Neptuniibacter sp. TaxID=502143 RepID=UPI002637AFE8|nr:aldo/keto reductase [uncultured Neptuniibacter sp.]